MRDALARRLQTVATSLAGGCPCEPCAAVRRADELAARHARALSRSERRAIHRGAWRLGLHGRGRRS